MITSDNFLDIEKPLVIYHGGCRDGFCAAWIADWKWPEADILPAQYKEDPPYALAAGRDVIVVDFSYPREQLLQLKEKAKSLHVLDHHKTAEADLAGLDFCLFDMDRSGAGLALDLFFPGRRGASSTAGVWGPDRVALYVEDRDLWKWKLPQSKAINTYLGTVPLTLDAWAMLPSIFSMADEGNAMLKYETKIVEDLAAGAYSLQLDEGEVLCVNAPILQSEVGNYLANRAPAPLKTALMWSPATGGAMRYSFRSAEDGADVSVMAKKRGGGGHTHAAGYTVFLK